MIKQKYEILRWCPSQTEHLSKLNCEFDARPEAVEFLKGIGELYYCFYNINGFPELLYYVPKINKKYYIKHTTQLQPMIWRKPFITKETLPY